jgi:putative transposase
MTRPRRSTAANATWRWTHRWAAAGVLITPASTQDRDGGRRLLWRLRRQLPTIRLVWADAGDAGRLVTWAAQVLTLTVQIVRKRPGVHPFEVLPRR